MVWVLLIIFTCILGGFLTYISPLGRDFGGFIFLWGMFFVAQLWIVGGIIFVAWHFISVYW